MHSSSQFVFTSRFLLTDPNSDFCLRLCRLATVSRLNSKVRQSQSYFTTGGLPSVMSSWRQAPWDSTHVVIVLTRGASYEFIKVGGGLSMTCMRDVHGKRFDRWCDHWHGRIFRWQRVVWEGNAGERNGDRITKVYVTNEYKFCRIIRRYTILRLAHWRIFVITEWNLRVPQQHVVPWLAV
jgi:hypothetical protein